jgi:presequence protease
MNEKSPTTHQAFEWLRSVPIDSLHLELQEYRHRATGARHLHIASEDTNNAFLVAFLTVPQDSTGVAHILEHTALCGSERYPVRDPFFMMTRRSLSTFMNAFTASDWTAYPFASRNHKDFENLLRVYLDAAFFPRLDPLDFAQEGHRLELAESADPDSPLVYKGVVYNEMKGAMSSPVTALWQSLAAHLFPTVTYHHNSGGDPAAIPDLTHEQLKAFHATHYHPSNAFFMTYGDLPAGGHQALFEECALGRFERKALDLCVPDEHRYTQPLAVEESYAVDDPAEAGEDRTHIVLGWLLGHNTDPETVLSTHLLNGILLDNSAAPLRKALETSELGSAPSPLCGLDDTMREMVFACGLEGSRPEHAEALEALVMGVLREVAEHGVPQENVEAVLHQVELTQREIGGDHFPYGLQLMMNALTPALHGGDPAAALDLDPVLTRLREHIRDPDYIKGLARHCLLDNPHRVRLVFRPDPELTARREAATAERLATVRAALSSEARAGILERTAALAARQQQQDDPGVLPKVGLDDIPRRIDIPEGSAGELAGMPLTWYAANTNGLVYQQLVIDLPDLEAQLLDLLPLYCDTITEVGSGGRDYLATQAWQSAVSGGIGARMAVRGAVEDVQRVRGVLVLSSKALVRNAHELPRLIRETFETARLDELRRLRELVAQNRAEAVQGITDRGHAYAMLAAASGLSPAAALAHRWDGLEGVRALKRLDRTLDAQEALRGFAERLEQLRERLLHAPRQLLVIGEAQHEQAIRAGLASVWERAAPRSDAPRLQPAAAQSAVHQAWSTSTQVSFCAKAYATVPLDHPDAPVLAVLSDFLRNGYLHRAVREQGGAYGGGAGYDGDSGAFRFYSYRDPRLAETLQDFDRALEWLQSERHEWRSVEEAILGVISRIDRPASPAGEAKRAFHEALHGRTPEQRRRFRARVLEVGLEDLQRVARTWLVPARASVAVVTSPSAAERSRELGLELHSI